MKEYKLLRNNKETGPYSLDELKGMNLKPFDLIWHQKKSASWRYPSEMDELAAYVSIVETVSTSVVATNNKAVLVEDIRVAETAQDSSEYKAETITAAEEEETPVRYIRHVVALKPTIDNTQVKTIKSTNQPNIVKVEVRDKEAAPGKNDWDETALFNNKAYQAEAVRNNSSLYTTVDKSVAINEYSGGVLSPKIMQTEVADNKLEWMVLIIGATSLIAIVYLLLTSPY